MSQSHSLPNERRRLTFALQCSLLASLLLVALTSGCRKVEMPTTPPTTSTQTTTIAGRITDESGLPVAGVAVTATGGSATTDANGLFAIPDVAVTSGRAFVIAKKSGYFNGARAAVATIGKVTYIKFSIATSTNAGLISGNLGGTVTLPTGASIALSPAGVVTSTGSAYTGTVTVFARYLDPAVTWFTPLFAGDLVAQAADGSQTVLTSAGVILAELHGSTGEILQPAPGKPAVLTMPITPTQRATATATIPLWYFDETLGMWKEEGSATKVGNNYVGNVQHFSAWNYDWKGPWGTIHGRIVCGGVPIPGIAVNVGTSGAQPVTDGSGEFTVKVPAETNNIQIQVLSAQNGGLYYMNSAKPVAVPRDVTTEIGDFSLDSPCPSWLSGTLKDCNGNGVAGMILASWTGGMSYIYTTDGAFKMVAGASQLVTFSGTAKSGTALQPQSSMTGAQGGMTTVDLTTCVDVPSNVLIDITGTYDGRLLAFSPDGKILATLATNLKDVILLDTKTGNTLAQLTGAFSGGKTQDSTGGLYVRFSPDGSKLLTLSNEFYPYRINCWKLDGTNLTPTGIRSTGLTAAFTQDGSAVIHWISDTITLPHANGIYEYDIAQGKDIQQLSLPASYGEMILGLASGGTQLVVVSEDMNSRAICNIWDLGANQSVSSFPLLPSLYFWNVASSAGSKLSPDGRIIGLVESGNRLHFVDLQSRAEISTSSISGPYNASFGINSDDASFIGQYRAGPGNTVGLFSLADGMPLRAFAAPVAAGYSSGVTVSPDGTLAAAVYSNVVRIWKLK